jgi:hypothetical protein
MNMNHINYTVFAFIIIIFCSCSTPEKIEKAQQRKPAITLQIASLELANLNKRIERRHIIELAKILKHEQVEIFAVQGISRYPGVATRVDFVNELSAQTDWRNAFGETMNISGRQTGNAVFSLYPILSQQNISFDKLLPASMETALQVSVDAGVCSLLVISTQFPAKATPEEQIRCIKLMAGSNPNTINPIIFAAGNLPSSEIIRKTYAFADISFAQSAKSTNPKIWYLAGPSVQYLSSRSIETELGKILIAQFGLY